MTVCIVDYSKIDNECMSLIYSAVSMLFLAFCALMFFYVSRISDSLLKMIMNRYFIIIKDDVRKFNYIVPILLFLVVVVLTALMLINYIDVKLYSYVCGAIIFIILLVVYHNLYDNLIKFTKITKDIGSNCPLKRIYYLYWNIENYLSICMSYELTDQLYYYLWAIFALCIMLIVNYFSELIEVKIDFISFMFWSFVLIQVHMFCRMEIFAFIFATILLYICSKYECDIIYKCVCFISIVSIRQLIVMSSTGLEILSNKYPKIPENLKYFITIVKDVMFYIFCLYFLYKLIKSIQFTENILEGNYYMIVIAVVLFILLTAFNVFKTDDINLFSHSCVDFYQLRVLCMFYEFSHKDTYDTINSVKNLERIMCALEKVPFFKELIKRLLDFDCSLVGIYRGIEGQYGQCKYTLDTFLFNGLEYDCNGVEYDNSQNRIDNIAQLLLERLDVKFANDFLRFYENSSKSVKLTDRLTRIHELLEFKEKIAAKSTNNIDEDMEIVKIIENYNDLLIFKDMINLPLDFIKSISDGSVDTNDPLYKLLIKRRSLFSFYNPTIYTRVVVMFVFTFVFFVISYFINDISCDIFNALLYIFPAFCLLFSSYIPRQNLSSIISVILFIVYIVVFLNNENVIYLYIILGLMLINIVIFNIKSYFIDKHMSIKI